MMVRRLFMTALGNLEENRVQDKDRQVAIANTIKSQISIYALMSMGANKFNWIKETQKYSGGLSFEFQNTSKIKKGRIHVQLTWSDTYTVVLIGIDWKKEKVFKIVKDVYCDTLSETLDRLVETDEILSSWKR